MAEAKVAFIWQFPAVINDWHDGDTCSVHRQALADVVIHGEHIRVEGINAPELHAAGGAESLAYAKEIAPAGTHVTLVHSRRDKYGRVLARVVLPDGSDFSTMMIAAGQAIAYNP